MEYASAWVVSGDFKGMCETLNYKNVSSEDTCFGIRSEIAAVNSWVLLYLGTVWGFFKYSFKWEKSWKKKWGAQRDRGRESALVLELNVTCQYYNHVCTASEKTVLGDIFTAQKRKRKDLKASLNLQKLKKDKENLLVAHSTSRGGRIRFMHSRLLKAIPCRSSAQKRPLGFPFCLWHGKSHISKCRKKCPQVLWFQRNSAYFWVLY